MKKASVLHDELRSRGFRLTPARKAILEIVTQSSEPLTAKEIHGALIKRGIASDKVTVYREIGFLARESFLAEVQFHDRNKRFELADLDHHHHLICQKCARIQDIILTEDFEKEAEAIGRRKKFRILRHSLEFFGLCKSCA